MKCTFKNVLCFCFAIISLTVFGQITDPVATEVWEPEPRVVVPGHDSAPSDAVVLFDGSNTDSWTHKDGSPIKWLLEDGVMTVVGGTGAIFSKQKFGDCQLQVRMAIGTQPQLPCLI